MNPDADLQALVTLMQTATGLSVDENRVRDLRRVADALLVITDLPDVGALVDRLATLSLADRLWQDLVNTITISETYFFRNQAHFTALREHLLPDLLAQRRAAGIRQLRIWSAGCATGEEPYSIAMLLADLLPDQSEWIISILATDVDLVSLEKARRGLYRPSSFRNETPEDLRARWFTETPDGFLLDERIRERVTFAPLNLVGDRYPAYENGTMGLDLIICRNVTIYFDAATTQTVVGHFSEALQDDGWLIVGHSEPVASTYQEKGFVPRNFTNAVFYQKNLEEAARQPSLEDLLERSKAATQTSPPSPSRERTATRPRKPDARTDAQMRKARSLTDSQIRKARALTDSQMRKPRPLTPPEPAPAVPPEPPPQLLAARAAADRGDWDEALALAKQVIDSDPMNAQAHYLRGLVQMQQDDLNAALHALRQAIYCEPRFALAQYTLGELYEKRQSLPQAARHWRLALEIVQDLDPETRLWFSEDLTADMLRGLLVHRLDRLPDGPET